jgi:hypothetical protein
MLSLRRILLLLAACCAVAVTAVPTLASANGGTYGRWFPASRQAHMRGAKRICRLVGAPLGGSAGEPRPGLLASGKLTETQVKELQAACNSLAAAFTADRTAVAAAAKTRREAVEAARAKLNGVCPPSSLPWSHHDAWWHHEEAATTQEISAACEEALKAYRASVQAADESFQKTSSEAAKTFFAALSQFETTVQGILGPAASNSHYPQPGNRQGNEPSSTGPCGHHQEPGNWSGSGNGSSGSGSRPEPGGQQGPNNQAPANQGPGNWGPGNQQGQGNAAHVD